MEKLARSEERRILMSLFMISHARLKLYRHNLLSLLLWQRLNLTSSSNIIHSLTVLSADSLANLKIFL